MDRRRLTLMLLAAGLMSGVTACGRRGPLEPPPDTVQGRAWQRRVGDKQQPQRTPGGVRNSLEREDEQKGTVDVEADIERPRGEGLARSPSDPLLSAPNLPGQQVANPRTTSGPASAVDAPLTGSRRRPPGIVPPKRDFILDGLLE